jgi:hypothetical protein
VGGAGDEGGEEVGDLVPGQRDLVLWRDAAGALGSGCDGEDGGGKHGQGDPPVPGGPAADLVLVQAGQALSRLEVLLDGLITNGKFCCVRRVRLSLSWWHRPLRLRGSALQRDVALVGEPDDPDLDRVPAARPVSRRRAPVGSGLPAAGAVGRRRRPAGSGADRRGGA